MPSCCPWTSTRAARAPPAPGPGASWPPIRAVLRPSAPTRARAPARRRPSHRRRRHPGGRVEPSLHAGRVAPGRTSVAEARRPSASASPTVTIVLPVPVSPVRTFRPGSSSRSTSSITPRPEMCSSRSIYAWSGSAGRCRAVAGLTSAIAAARRGAGTSSGAARGTSERRRAGRTATAVPPRPIRTRAPTGSSRLSRPSADSDPGSSPWTSSVTRSSRASDERAIEDHVGRDRRHDDARHRRRDDRPAGRERVRGRPRRGGDDHPVGGEAS